MQSTRSSASKNTKTFQSCTTISTIGTTHSLHEEHNQDTYEQASYLFSLFDDGCMNSDELIVQFANENPDFELFCYIQNVFETRADAFMLSSIFCKKKVLRQLMKTNKHKLDKLYPYGLGLMSTPREVLDGLLVRMEDLFD